MIKNSRTHILSTVVLATTMTIATPLTCLFYVSTQRAAVAVNIPNFSPRVAVESDRVNLYLPTAFVQGVVNEVLRANEGRFEDTEFNRKSIFNMRATVTGSIIRVDGEWRAEHRERISCIGRCRHTPWASVSGRFSQDFQIGISANQLQLRPSGNLRLTGNSRWYGSFVDIIASLFAGRVTNSINAQLATINGLNVRDLLIQQASTSIAQRLGVDESQARQVLSQGIESISASIRNSELIVSTYINLPTGNSLTSSAGGYFDDGRGAFYSNGSSYCGFASPGHLQFFRRVNSAPDLGRRDPSSGFGEFTGACVAPSG